MKTRSGKKIKGQPRRRHTPSSPADTEDQEQQQQIATLRDKAVHDDDMDCEDHKKGAGMATREVVKREDENSETEDEHSVAPAAPPLIKDVSIFNNLDFHLQMAITDPKLRSQHWDACKFYYKNYAFAGHKFGRIWARWLLAGILVDVTSQPAYGEDVEQMKMNSIVSWNSEDWDGLIQDLEAARNACVRRDRNFAVLSNSVSEDQSISSRLETMKCLTKSTKNIENACIVNQVVAPIRHRIETQILAGKTGAPVVNDEKRLAVFETVCQSKHPLILKYGLLLFRRKERTETDDDADKENYSDESDPEDDAVDPQLHDPVLKDLEELSVVLKAKPFDLNWLVDKFEKVLNECHNRTLTSSVLMALHYSCRGTTNPVRLPNQTTPESRAYKLSLDRQADLSGLKRCREALNNNHGEDPLDESREIAKECTGVARETRAESNEKQNNQHQDTSNNGPVMPHKGSTDDGSKEESPTRGKRFYEVKKIKARLSFGDSESDDENEPSPKRATLSQVPPQLPHVPVVAKPRTGGPTYYDGPPPDEGIFDELGNVVRRIPWSDDETNCVIAALQRDSSLVGNWVGIKCMYAHQLRNRTSVQIKDKYRNLQNKGELDFLKASVPEQQADESSDEEIEDVV